MDGLSGAMRLPAQNEAGEAARAQSLVARAAMEGLGVDSGGTTGELSYCHEFSNQTCGAKCAQGVSVFRTGGWRHDGGQRDGGQRSWSAAGPPGLGKSPGSGGTHILDNPPSPSGGGARSGPPPGLGGPPGMPGLAAGPPGLGGPPTTHRPPGLAVGPPGLAVGPPGLAVGPPGLGAPGQVSALASASFNLPDRMNQERPATVSKKSEAMRKMQEILSNPDSDK